MAEEKDFPGDTNGDRRVSVDLTISFLERLKDLDVYVWKMLPNNLYMEELWSERNKR